MIINISINYPLISNTKKKEKRKKKNKKNNDN